MRNNKGNPLNSKSFQVAFKNKKYIGITTFGGVEYENSYPKLINKDIFEKVQERLASVAHAPASNKAKQNYLLRGKAYCGNCGTRLVGESGRGKSGKIYSYYACSAKKKHHNCNKRNEKKGFLEWYAVEQTVNYVLTPARMEFIADRVVEEYDKEFNDIRIKQYERRISKLERDADKVFKLIMATDETRLIKRYEKQISELDTQRENLEIDLSKLRIANNIRYTKKDIIAWMKIFCKGDPLDEEFQRRIIDVFINSIYVYDNKIVIYYNIKNGKQISYIDNCEALDGVESGEIESYSGGNSVRISESTLRQKTVQIP